MSEMLYCEVYGAPFEDSDRFESGIAVSLSFFNSDENDYAPSHYLLVSTIIQKRERTHHEVFLITGKSGYSNVDRSEMIRRAVALMDRLQSSYPDICLHVEKVKAQS